MNLRKFGSDITGYDPGHARMRILPAIMAAVALKKGIDAYQKNKAAKTAAGNNQKAAQYQVNQQQKTLNRKFLNQAALLRALKREGWYGDPTGADGKATAGFMVDKGRYDANDFNLDEVPRDAVGSAWGQALAAGAGGALDAYTGYMGDREAAVNQAKIEAARRAGG